MHSTLLYTTLSEKIAYCRTGLFVIRTRRTYSLLRRGRQPPSKGAACIYIYIHTYKERLCTRGGDEDDTCSARALELNLHLQRLTRELPYSSRGGFGRITPLLKISTVSCSSYAFEPVADTARFDGFASTLSAPFLTVLVIESRFSSVTSCTHTQVSCQLELYIGGYVSCQLDTSDIWPRSKRSRQHTYIHIFIGRCSPLSVGMEERQSSRQYVRPSVHQGKSARPYATGFRICQACSSLLPPNLSSFVLFYFGMDVIAVKWYPGLDVTMQIATVRKCQFQLERRAWLTSFQT